MTRLKDAEKNWEHFVYRLFDADGRLLYVGCSEDPENRILIHKRFWLSRSPNAFEIARRYHHHIISEPYATRLEARAAERAAIFAEQPEFNVHHKTFVRASP